MEKISKLIVGLILILGIIFLILGHYFDFFVAISHVLSAWFFALVVKKIKINKNYEILICFFLLLSFFGEIYLYKNFEYYDKILHLIIPFFMTMMAYSYVQKIKINYKKISIFLVILGMLALFELTEYFFDVILGLDMIGVQSRTGSILLDNFTDTMFDLIFGATSSLLYLIFKK